jgi:putative hydrolase of the HAD superfamily
MKNAFAEAGRKEVFPSLLARFPGLSITLDDMVRVYREHVPEIHLFPGYRKLLEELGKKYRLGIITDGLSAVQRGKVRALGIEGLFEKIIYSWDYGKERQKPHLYPFTLMLEALRIPPQAALFAGDNPEKDGLGARGAGMIYVRIAPPVISGKGAMAGGREERLSFTTGSDEIVIENLLQLPRILMHYEGNCKTLTWERGLACTSKNAG